VQPDDPRIIEKYWSENAHLRDIVPAKWCSEVSSLTLRTEYAMPDAPEDTARLDVSVGIVGGSFRVPPRSDTYGAFIVVPPDAVEVVEHVRHAQEQRVINNKWKKVTEDVMSFLDSCKSLNEALKLWPDLRVYIPDDYINKAEEKTVKAKAAESKAMEILKQIDTDHAISSAVMVRILEASKQQENQA
jgi:hypothetical protein